MATTEIITNFNWLSLSITMNEWRLLKSCCKIWALSTDNDKQTKNNKNNTLAAPAMELQRKSEYRPKQYNSKSSKIMTLGIN